MLMYEDGQRRRLESLQELAQRLEKPLTSKGGIGGPRDLLGLSQHHQSIAAPRILSLF